VGTTIRITGRVVLDDGNPVEGAEVSVTEPGSGRTPLSPESSFGRATSLSDTHLDDWDLSDPATYLKPRRRGSPDPGAPPGFVVQAVGGGDGSAVTDSSGEFTVSHLVDELPARVAVEVRYVPPDGPTVNNSRVVEAGTSELD